MDICYTKSYNGQVVAGHTLDASNTMCLFALHDIGICNICLCALHWVLLVGAIGCDAEMKFLYYVHKERSRYTKDNLLQIHRRMILAEKSRS